MANFAKAYREVHREHLLRDVNAMDQEAFTKAFGPVFEHSPWVAKNAWKSLPFKTVSEMHSAMIQVIKDRSQDERVAFICGHPELAGKEARTGSLTPESESEQSGAGLNSLTKTQLEEIGALNKAYRQRHGFPFVICVRHYTRAGIFAEFSRRLERDTDTELAEAIEQIGFITRLRLNDLVKA